MFWEVNDGPQNFFGKLLPVSCQRFEDTAPGVAVGAQRLHGAAQIAFQHDGGAVVEWMCERRRRMNPFDSVLLKRQGRKKWRSDGHGVDGRSEVMEKAGESEWQGPRAAADCRLGFVYLNSITSLCEDDCGG